MQPDIQGSQAGEVRRKPAPDSRQENAQYELTHTVQQGASPQQASVQRQEEPAAATPAADAPGDGWIVEDEQAPEQWQLRKTAFLARLNEHLCAVVDEALAGTRFTALGCPILQQIFATLQTRTAAQIEQLALRLDPEARIEVDAESLIGLIGIRVRQIAANWVRTGEIIGLPPELTAQLPSNWQEMARMAASSAGGLLGSLASASGSLLSSLGGLFFKARPGGAVQTQSPESVMMSLGQGQSMDGGTRGKMEGAFGSSFSDVQIHTDSNAVQLNQEMNSRAFTVGNHVAFGGGEYRPGSLVGDALMAHELAHVEQQRNSIPTAMAKSSGPDHQLLESEANDSAAGVVTQLHGEKNDTTGKLPERILPKLKTGLQLQRCGTSGPEVEWDGDVSKLRIDVYTTTNLSEPPVDPGEAVTSDFVSFALRLNYYQYATVAAYYLLNNQGTRIDARYPDQDGRYKGLSRMMRPPMGAYTIVADGYIDATRQSLQVKRPIQVIESYKTLSSAQAPEDLKKQAGHTLEGDLIAYEQLVAVLRQNAVKEAGVPASLAEAWNAAHTQAVLVEASINGSIKPEVSVRAREEISNFYKEFRNQVSSSDVTHPAYVKMESDGLGHAPVHYPATVTNPYQTQEQTDTNLRALNTGGSSSAEWRTSLNTFYEITAAFNKYVAKKLEDAGLKDSAKQLATAGTMSNHLRKLYRDHPDAKPTKAVFYPKQQPGLKNDAPSGAVVPHYPLTGLPLKMYVYRTDDEVWHLVDMTRPDRVFETEEEGGTAAIPPRRLMTELDSPERFPEGMLYWQFEGSARDQHEMTHPWSASDVLNFISTILALAGLTALVIFSGGTAAPAAVPTALFILSGVAGAAGAAAHMHESAELGTLTAETKLVDSLIIAANLLTVGAMGASQIVRGAQVAETAWTGTRALATLGAQTVYRPLQIAALATDVITFSTLTFSQFNQIKDMPEGEAKTTAMRRLVAVSLITGGMTLMSVRGGLHDLTMGKTLFLDITMINGVRTPVAYRVLPQADILAHPRLGTAKADAETFLARKDVNAGTLDQFRGELSISLETSGIAETEIRAFVQQVSKAAPGEIPGILASFRNNRVKVAVGGVSRNTGYDLTYLHISETDFHSAVLQAFDQPGVVAHNGQLYRVEGEALSNYHLGLEAANGTRVDADVMIVYQDFSKGSAIGAGPAAPNAAQGPARNVITWDSGKNQWTIRIEVDHRLAPKDIRRALGHELDEASDAIHRLEGNQGPDIQQQIGALQAPGKGGLRYGVSSHDLATLQEINYLNGQRAKDPRANESILSLASELGFPVISGADPEKEVTRIMGIYGKIFQNADSFSGWTRGFGHLIELFTIGAGGNSVANRIANKIASNPNIQGIDSWTMLARRHSGVESQILDLEVSLDEAILQSGSRKNIAMEVNYLDGARVSQQDLDAAKSQSGFTGRKHKNVDLETSTDRKEFKRINQVLDDSQKFNSQAKEAWTKFKEGNILNNSGGKKNIGVLVFENELLEKPGSLYKNANDLKVRLEEYIRPNRAQGIDQYLEKFIIRIRKAGQIIGEVEVTII